LDFVNIDAHVTGSKEAPLYLLEETELTKEMCVASGCLSCGTFRREL